MSTCIAAAECESSTRTPTYRSTCQVSSRPLCRHRFVLSTRSHGGFFAGTPSLASWVAGRPTPSWSFAVSAGPTRRSVRCAGRRRRLSIAGSTDDASSCRHGTGPSPRSWVQTKENSDPRLRNWNFGFESRQSIASHSNCSGLT